MGGENTARWPGNQAGLCKVRTFFALIQQHKVFALVGHVNVFDELRFYQRAAFCIKSQLEHIGAGNQALTCHDRSRTGRDGHGSGCAGHLGRASGRIGCWLIVGDWNARRWRRRGANR